jgi:hypothetical protein
VSDFVCGISVILTVISVTGDDDTGVLKWREYGRGTMSLSEGTFINDVSIVDLIVKR